MEWLQLQPGEVACAAFARIDLLAMVLRDGEEGELVVPVLTLKRRWRWSYHRVERFLLSMPERMQIAWRHDGGTKAAHVTLCQPELYMGWRHWGGTEAARRGAKSTARVSVGRASHSRKEGNRLEDPSLDLVLPLATSIERHTRFEGGKSEGGKLSFAPVGMNGNGEVGADGTRTEEVGHAADVSVLLPGMVEDGRGNGGGPGGPKGVSDRVGRAAIRAVLEGCERVTGHRLKLTDGRAVKIRARLEDGYSVDELIEAMRKAHSDPFFRGDNDRGKRYDWPETVFKNSETVERHLAHQSEDERREVERQARIRRYEEAYGPDVARA